MIKWRRMSRAVKNTRKMKSNLKRDKHGEKIGRNEQAIEWAWRVNEIVQREEREC